MLTELTLRQSTARDGRRMEIWDERVPGFGVRISPSGTKTFVLMYYVAGKKRRMTLGRYPILSLVDARRKALAALNQVAHGSDPQGERRADHSPYQFAAVVEDFVRAHCARHNRESHARETERILRSRFVTEWQSRDIRDIARADVLRVLDAAVDAGTPSAANHALAAIRKLFNWCIERGIVETSPCLHISRPAPHNSRDRVLSEDEIAEVWTASQSLSAPFSHIVQLLLLTAQRRGEVAGMCWDEIDWRERSWTIPPERTKNNRVQTLPLSRLAIEVLQSVPKLHERFVFPARGNDAATPSGFSKMKRRLDSLSRTSSWTLHDLRRTAATHMARAGVAPHIIERILNHSTGLLGGVAGIYNRFQYLPEMRDALEQWSETIVQLSARSER